jgi:hypothetical protein
MRNAVGPYRERKPGRPIPISALQPEALVEYRSRIPTVPILCCVVCGKPIGRRAFLVVLLDHDAVMHGYACEDPETMEPL